MCGIAGIISKDPDKVNSHALKLMADTLIHRGPESEAQWMNESRTAGMSHRRLSIVDLSECGAQPMHYLARYTIVYNGEIYNYPELRKELMKAGYSFHSKSDTEVILAAYDCYKSRCLQYFDGMFAFAIWDEKHKRLFAARDRFGEKPFYYHNDGSSFYFGSEMKALWALGIKKEVEDKMLLNYLSIGQVQNPADKSQTFYKEIFSLPPAHYLELDHDADKLSVISYWDIDKQICHPYSDEKALFNLDSLLTTSVHRRLRSDVPVGSSVSGGLDSSTIAWYVHKELKDRSAFKTFSAVFPGFEKDESKHIEDLTSHLNFQNFTVTPDEKSLADDFEKLMYHQEEPFSSSSIYAQYRVYKLAKEHGVTVVIDGQGADEILAGYPKYIHWYLQEFIGKHKYIRARRELNAFRKNDVYVEWGFKNIAASFLPSHAAMALEKKEFGYVKHNKYINPELISGITGNEWEGIHKPVITKLNDILYFNTMQSGLEELLRYADRNAMAHSVEVRLPFLNHELVQFVFSLSSYFKMQDGYTKYILRYLMNDRLPDSITWRKDKVGFEPPQKKWMDTAVMNDLIHESKKKLVDKRILKSSVLQQSPSPMHAHEQHNRDWRYLCISRIL